MLLPLHLHHVIQTGSGGRPHAWLSGSHPHLPNPVLTAVQQRHGGAPVLLSAAAGGETLTWIWLRLPSGRAVDAARIITVSTFTCAGGLLLSLWGSLVSACYCSGTGANIHPSGPKTLLLRGMPPFL